MQMRRPLIDVSPIFMSRTIHLRQRREKFHVCVHMFQHSYKRCMVIFMEGGGRDIDK